MSQPGFSVSTGSPLVARRPAAARHLDRSAVDLLQKLGHVAGDEIDDMCLKCRAGRQAGGVADSLFGPVGVAPAQLGQAADEGHEVIGHLRRHRVILHGRRLVLVGRLVLIRLAVTAVPVAIAIARQPRQRPADLDRCRSAEIGARRHRRHMGCIEDVGAGAGRMAAGRSDVADDRNRRGEYVGDDLARAGDEAARRVEPQDHDFGTSFGCDCQSFVDIFGGRGADRPVDLDRQGKPGLAALLRCRRGDGSRGSDQDRCEKGHARQFHAQKLHMQHMGCRGPKCTPARAPGGRASGGLVFGASPATRRSSARRRACRPSRPSAPPRAAGGSSGRRRRAP